MKKCTLLAIVSAFVFVSGAAVAENTPTWTEFRGKPIADSHHLNENIIAFKLVEMGYDNFVGYEVDQGLWKVEADKNGQRLALWVNPYFGNVVHEKLLK